MTLLDRTNPAMRGAGMDDQDIFVVFSFSGLRPIGAYAPVGRKGKRQSAYRRRLFSSHVVLASAYSKKSALTKCIF